MQSWLSSVTLGIWFFQWFTESVTFGKDRLNDQPTMWTVFARAKVTSKKISPTEGSWLELKQEVCRSSFLPASNQYISVVAKLLWPVYLSTTVLTLFSIWTLFHLSLKFLTLHKMGQSQPLPIFQIAILLSISHFIDAHRNNHAQIIEGQMLDSQLHFTSVNSLSRLGRCVTGHEIKSA